MIKVVSVGIVSALVGCAIGMIGAVGIFKRGRRFGRGSRGNGIVINEILSRSGNVVSIFVETLSMRHLKDWHAKNKRSGCKYWAIYLTPQVVADVSRGKLPVRFALGKGGEAVALVITNEKDRLLAHEPIMVMAYDKTDGSVESFLAALIRNRAMEIAD